ncbi:UDP-N-acetylmuramate dehydrogenase [Marinoscillum sp. MHG1-6]|uniref:UDP-N-acetylmuramate dehydrogenase n=1 Tax=Marinoscillum sp. MHG1-6 TaxID=2959627 RepID=UPI00280BBDE8|nr:UDP-N-acetylmuramate dehydrogenase [Marinoscillum sp. MHG1-6]
MNSDSKFNSLTTFGGDTPQLTTIVLLEERHASLKAYNTFRLDVKSDYLMRITDVNDLSEIYESQQYKRLKKLILGGGSNVLFTRNFLGIILKMEISGIKVEEDSSDSVIVSFGAGENWHQCVLWAIDQGLGGVENLSLIPGTVGAAPIQNIGAYGVELKEVFHSLEAYEVKTGKIVRFYNEDCKFGYRYSVFKGAQKGKYAITRVYLRLSKKPTFNIEYGNLKQKLEEMGVEELSLKSVSQAVIDIRQSKLPDPMVIGNAGSFFKNPVIENEHFESLKAAFDDIPGYPADEESTKVPAAWLIDQCGWKGKRFGEVGVHEKQALVLVNHGNGKGRDLVHLSKDIQNSVFKKYGINLDPEVNVI